MRGANARFGHVITAMVSPFRPDGALDCERAAALASWLIAQGNDALVINGTTGEASTMSVDERLAQLAAVSAAIGREKVIAGVGGNDTAAVCHMARASAEAGAGALLAVAPYYNRPSQEGMYQHFRAVADATDLPVLLYNVPTRSAVNIDASTTARLAADAPTIVGTKEASANLAQVGEILRTTPDDFVVYSGDDGVILPLVALGGAGVISVIGHVVGPDLAALHRAWFAGDAATAAALFLKTLPVTRALFSVPSPAPVKFALERLGQRVGGLRLPLVAVTPSEGEAIVAALRAYGLPL
jgi:4-hydroxy-tetrahydrodipicolinate synthase